MVLVLAEFDIGYGYGEKMFKKCKQQKNMPKGTCGKLQELVEEIFDQQGTALAGAMQISLDEAARHAKNQAFVESGSALLDEMLEMAETVRYNLDELKKEFVPKFFKWWSSVLKNKPKREAILPNGLKLGDVSKRLKRAKK